MENRIARGHGCTTYVRRFESLAGTPKIRFSPWRHCVAAKHYVVFILPWKLVTESHTGICRDYADMSVYRSIINLYA